MISTLHEFRGAFLGALVGVVFGYWYGVDLGEGALAAFMVVVVVGFVVCYALLVSEYKQGGEGSTE